MDLNQIINQIYYGNYVYEYIYALCALFITLFVISIIKNVFIRNIEKLTKKTKIKADDLIVDIARVFNWPIYILISLYTAFKFVSVADIITRIIGYAAITLGAYYAVKIIQLIIDYITDQFIADKDRGKTDKTIIDFISKSIKAVVWVVAVLVIIQNLGYDVTALAAGLGIGGIAVAFALQNVLGEIFASLSIFLDKPFKIGDYITIGKDQGEIKRIGLRSTRIKTLEGETLIIPNKEVSESRVHNYRKMKDRRVTFKIGVTYETSNQKLKEIPSLIENVISNVKQVDFERCHFKKFGDSALIFNIVYIVKSRQYPLYLDLNQQINYKIRDNFEKEGIEMAYPTQTLHINNLN